MFLDIVWRDIHALGVMIYYNPSSIIVSQGRPDSVIIKPCQDATFPTPLHVPREHHVETKYVSISNKNIRETH
jgi:hypothetical protein